MRIDETTPAGISSAAVYTTQREADLEKACKDFESLFLLELLKQARLKLLSDSGVDTPGKSLLEQFALEELSRELAYSGGTGIWKLLYESLSGVHSRSAETYTSGASPRRP